MIFKKCFLLHSILWLCFFSAASQNIDKIINAAEVERIERTLSADDMQGRKTFTPGIDKAADFIAEEFAKSGLSFFGNNKSYFQEIVMIKSQPTQMAGMLDDDSLTTANTIVSTTMPSIAISYLNDYELVVVNKEDDFNKVVYPLMDAAKNLVILVDTFHVRSFNRMKRFATAARFSNAFTQVLILTPNLKPQSLSLQIKNQLTEQRLKNVVGVLPGKSKKDEYVVFSGHYDHLGIGRPNKEQDSIYNGANDDAAGTAAVIMLGKYFSKIKNNERSLIFAAFTAEEIGGYGSRFFSKQVDVDKIVAMFNIEMIGTDSKWGANSAYITGYEKSDLGKILQANLAGSVFRFEPDPYPAQNLFYRSDNATLAKMGVPAHTISTSKMDSEKYYHTVDDEIETLDMVNMAEIIKAIAISSRTIVSGKDTPTRVKLEN